MTEPTNAPIENFSAHRFWRTFFVMLTFVGVSACAAVLARPASTIGLAAKDPQLAELMNDESFPGETPALPPAGQAGQADPATAQPDLIHEVIQPFAHAALTARAERAQRDPDYSKRIDLDLNKHRINFLLFGYGETYEPPLPKDIIGSITIMSLDTRTYKIAQISLTHDARAPEIERYLQARGLKAHPSKIDQTYKIGGFDLMRLAVENATGLAIDFQMVVEDVVIKHLVDEVLGGIEVDSPFDLAVNPIYVQGTRYAGMSFVRGRQTCDGLKTMGYLKGLSLPPYDRAKENNNRKAVVFRALSTSIQDNAQNPLFHVKALSFLRSQLDRKTIEYDFDIKTLLLDGLKQLASASRARRLTMPSIDQNIYLVDERFGDGGFSWVMGTQNPIIKDELKRGIYKDTAMVVANGNPYAENLAASYWGSVRAIVKHRLIYGDAPMKRATPTCGEFDAVTAGGRARTRCAY